MITSKNTSKGITMRDEWECQEYHVVLRNEGRQLSTTFYVGMGWTEAPSAADVLGSLISDAQSVRWDGVDEWITNYGYEINALADVRKLEGMYRKIERQSAKLRQFLGEADYEAALDSDSEEWANAHAETRRVHT